MRPRLALSLIAGCLSAIVFYATTRIVLACVLSEPDPADAFYSEHSGFFWRALTSGYMAGGVAFMTWLLAPGAELRVARWLGVMAWLAAAFAALQGLLVP